MSGEDKRILSITELLARAHRLAIADRAILESSVDLAKELNMMVVAEGVETREDWDLVAALGCDLAQGYLIAKPMPGPDLPAWLKTWQPPSSSDR